MQEAESVRVTSKGQLVIPARLRRRLGIRRGTRMSIHEDGGRLILQPITDEFINSLLGCLKPRRGERSMLDSLLRERRRERNL